MMYNISMNEDKVKLSIVVPLFNEEESVPELLKQLIEVCDLTAREYEIIFIDDGSTDRTFDLIRTASEDNKRVKIIRLSRNFGHQAAFNAGLDFASGEMVITMDGDLQHPPNLIPEFIKHAELGNDLVLGERVANKQNSINRAFVGNVFYWLFRKMSNLDFRP